MASRFGYSLERGGGAVNGGIYAPLILIVDWLN